MAPAGGRVLAGGCQCGAARYALNGPVRESSACHCRMCQRAGGTANMVLAQVAAADLAWEGAPPATFRSSDVVERGFCARCGTPLTYRVLGSDGISVNVLTLDDPEAAPPTLQYAPGSRPSWADGVPALPVGRAAEDEFPSGVGSRQFDPATAAPSAPAGGPP